MTTLEELLIHAESHALALCIHPDDDGVTVALVGNETEVVASGEDSDAALEALVRCVRYRAAEGIGGTA